MAVNAKSRAISGVTWRLLLVPAALVGMYGAITTAVSNISAKANPALALAARPNNGLALASDAENRILTGVSRVDRSKARSQIVSALEREPLNPTALRVLSVLDDGAGSKNAATQLLQLSERTSRREFGTQLLLIERAVAAGQLDLTIVHYDNVLRVAGDGANVLLPILTAALAEADVRRRLAQTIQTNPPWLVSFINHVTADGAQVGNLGRTIIAAKGIGPSPDAREASDRLVAAIAANIDPVLAKETVLAYRPELRRFFNDAGLNSVTTGGIARPLLWEAVSASGLGAGFENEGKAARVFAGPGERGVALRRYLFLHVGQHAVAIGQHATGLGNGAGFRWSLTCRGASKALWTTSDDAPNGQFAVPANCESQLLELAVVGGLGQNDLEVLVDRVDIRRIQTPASGGA